MGAAVTGMVKNQWLASLYLQLCHSKHGTQLGVTKRIGPLSVQKAFYPEGKECAHLYLLHPPAGIVSGDELRITIDLKENAHGFVTTPGANRFYRARTDYSIGDPKQIQITSIQLASQSKCEHFPLETLVYNQADAVNNVEIRMQSDSVYCGWDITCLGLPSANQQFTNGQFTQLNKLYCDDILMYHDRITITPESQIQHHAAGLAGNTVFGTMLAFAPDTRIDEGQLKQLINGLRAEVTAQSVNSLISITQIRGILIIRYLGNQANQCKDIFIALWHILRPLYIEKPAKQPRIWFT